MKTEIFLGGSCGKTAWRDQIAIPILEKEGISYYNPQIQENEWTVEMRFEDTKAKGEADVFLFVIDGNTRAVASIGEVCYLIGQQQPLAIALTDVTEGTIINDQCLSASEIADLNRGRIFIRDIALSNQIPVFNNIEDAVYYSIQLVNMTKISLTEKKLKDILSQICYKEYSYEVENITHGFLLYLKNKVINTKTKFMDEMVSRKWYIPNNAQELEIIKTFFMAVLCWEEHEIREVFKYNGKAIFDPHSDLLNR